MTKQWCPQALRRNCFGDVDAEWLSGLMALETAAR